MTMSPNQQLLVEQAQATPMRAQVEAWSAINSGTTNLPGLHIMAAALGDAFSVLPGDLRLVPAEPEESISATGVITQVERGAHLHLAVRPQVSRRMLLTGHMDTVFAADHPFQSPVEIEPGIVNGPGVADMKGGLSVMLAALIAFEASERPAGLGYDVLINSDEETGSASSSALIAALAQGKIAALTYEPAALPDGTLAGARPGSGNFSFVIKGRSAHAGRNPDDGRNAVLAAAALALDLAALRAPGLSVNPARIDGGGPNNVVPDHAILRANFRPLGSEDQAGAQASIERAVRAIERSHGVGIAMHGGFRRPPKPIDAGALRLFELVRACGRDLGQTIGWQASGGVCDGNNIAARGVPVVDTMGVRGGSIHSGDEYLIVESLGERAALSALTLARLAALP